MTSVRKSLLQLIFSGASMKRWNDKLRPAELMEVDKQAHKMMVAWVLFLLNSKGMPDEERALLGARIVEGGIFDYLYRLVITDIKPPIFYKIKENPAHYDQLTEWVFTELAPRVRSLGDGFWGRLTTYLAKPSDEGLDRRILAAAHLYASGWEFNLIKAMNSHDTELMDIEDSFRKGLERHQDLAGVLELKEGLFGQSRTPIGHFAQVCGQLRFQKRWSQTPRIPETSVLGHMFIVACFAYFFSMSVGACRVRAQNNFFGGLFHDLPELLTRDIISPVKQSVEQIGDLIKEYEEKELERVILDPLRRGGYAHLVERLSFFLGLPLGSEFQACALVDGKVRAVKAAELQGQYNEDRFDPKDGELLKMCDHLAAFLEAYTALRNGIASDHLQQGLWRIRTRYASTVLFDTVHVGALLADFD
jgi:putative hydrolase of HD superfamily